MEVTEGRAGNLFLEPVNVYRPIWMRTDFAPSRSRQVDKEAQSLKDDVGAWVARINGQGLKHCHHARRGRSSSLAPSVEVSYPGFRRNTDAPGRSYSLESKAKSRRRLAGKVTAARMSDSSFESGVTLHPRAVIGSGEFLPRKRRVEYAVLIECSAFVNFRRCEVGEPPPLSYLGG